MSALEHSPGLEAPQTGNYFIASLSGMSLPPDSPVRRESPHTPELHTEDYEHRFDWLSLFYDIFWHDGRVVTVGPPLRNLASLVVDGNLRFDNDPVSPTQVLNFGNSDVLLFSRDGKPEHLDLDCGWFRASATVQPSETGVFAGRKVLCSISKNNRLEWIADWAEFHVKAHGADAVLFYDNASTDYTSADLLAVFRSIPGLEVAVVVPWNYRFGPAGKSKDWYRFTAQYVMLEHARRRFLVDAAAMVNLDVDELVVSDDGLGLFDHLGRSAEGVLIYPGRWIRNVRSSDPREIRHRFFRYYDTGEKPYLTKWTIIPSRLKETAELGVHTIRNAETPYAVHPGIIFRHFRAISTSWNYPRSSPDRYRRSNHVVDEALVRQMQKIGWIR